MAISLLANLSPQPNRRRWNAMGKTEALRQKTVSSQKGGDESQRRRQDQKPRKKSNGQSPLTAEIRQKVETSRGRAREQIVNGADKALGVQLDHLSASSLSSLIGCSVIG